MSVTTHGVYLVTDEDECFLGSVGNVLLESRMDKFPGEGISLTAFLIDIVQEIVCDPLGKSKTVTIEIRE